MKKLPKVSIITATFNLSSDKREEYFKKCCESIHNQTYKNIEHIVQDGGSKDGSLDLVKQYEKKGWLKCYSEPDKGIDDAYNKAISHTTGKYIFFMNSDDQYYDDTVIEKCVEVLEKEQADYCYGSERKYTRDGKFVYEWIPHLALFWHNVPYAHATLGIRKDVLQALGNYNTDQGYGGDYYLMISLILNGYKGVEVPAIISRYILGGVSSQTDNKATQYRTFFILAKRIHYVIQQFCPEITVEDCLNIYLHPDNPNVYPKNFGLKLIKFMLDKKLKYFNYNEFIDYVNFIAPTTYQHAEPVKETTKLKYRLFGFIPVLTKKKKSGKTKYKLFGFLPILTIKEKK